MNGSLTTRRDGKGICLSCGNLFITGFRVERARATRCGNTTCFDRLVSPLHGVPLCKPSSIFLQVSEGHFRYAALRETMKEIESWIVG